MKVYMIASRIIYVRFKTKEDLCKTMLRVSEYYDIQKFKNKKVPYRDYVDWYNEKKTEKDQPYDKAFFGMFLPGTYFRHFLKNYSGKDFTTGERELFEYLKKSIDPEFFKTQKKYAVVVSYEGMKSAAVQHELSHAAVYLSNVYEKDSNKIIKKINKIELDKMKKILVDMYNYPKYDIKEEIVSRLIERVSTKKTFKGHNIRVGKKIRDELRANLSSFLKN